MALATLLTPAYRQHPLPSSSTLHQNYFHLAQIYCLLGSKLLFIQLQSTFYVAHFAQNYCLH